MTAITSTPPFVELIPYTACPICGDASISVSRSADCSGYPHFKAPLSPSIQWMVCSVCGHSFRDGFYTKEAFEVLFSETHTSQRVGHALEQQRPIWGRVIEKVVRYRPSGYWLDVGFGNGALLLTAAEFGFVPLGIDVRKGNVGKLNSIGIRAIDVDFNHINIEPKVSVISMCDVLEHMRFPLQTLASAHRNLIPGGVLLISLPNLGSPIWKLLDQLGQNPYWTEMEHFHNFSRDSLCAILRNQGFSPVQYGISERYRACMEVIAIRENDVG
jgi:SAM-dependent methyltransferase